MSLFNSTFRWLQRKRYQYEVTFSLYMLTPTEKFIFNSFLFLFFSMIIIAATLYLPHHLAFLTNRAWFYYNGEERAKTGVESIVEITTQTIMFTGQIKETILNNEKKASAIMSAGKEL